MNTQISEDIFNYVQGSLPNIAPSVLEAFDILFTYGVPEVETRYRDTIVDENISGDERSDLFLGILLQDLTKIILAHGVEVSTDDTRSLRELLEMTKFFLKIQSLEDYTLMEGFISSLGDSREILIQLVSTYSDLSYIKASETIADVNPKTIEGLSLFIQQYKEVEEFKTFPTDRKITELFFKYLGDTPCLGAALFADGYDKILPIEDLVEILPFDIDSKLAPNIKSNVAQVALDILSLLMICSDSQKSPLEYLTENMDLFLEGYDEVTQVGYIVKGMYEDFYAENKPVIEEILNGNNQ